MIRLLLRGLGRGCLGVLALSAAAAAQTAPSEPGSQTVCVRLESQLALLDRGAVDPARAEEIKRYEAAVAKEQANLDRTLAQSRRYGCEGGGFFALFTGRAPQCGPLNSKVQQMRGNLDSLMSNLEQLKNNNTNDQSGQRRALIGQLAQNNCGPQYRAAAAAAGPGGFLNALFGGTIINPGGGDGAPSGTYRTVCVRTCDGYYFPISFSTVPSRFAQDQNTCQRQCPAAQAMLYSYHNPGGDMSQAVSLSGQPYTALASAFLYRRELAPSCSCRPPGESWAEALKNADDSSTIEHGDIVVTDRNENALSQLPLQKGATNKAPLKAETKMRDTAAAHSSDSPSDASSKEVDPAKRHVRIVGPPFLSDH